MFRMLTLLIFIETLSFVSMVNAANFHCPDHNNLQIKDGVLLGKSPEGITFKGNLPGAVIRNGQRILLNTSLYDSTHQLKMIKLLPGDNKEKDKEVVKHSMVCYYDISHPNLKGYLEIRLQPANAIINARKCVVKNLKPHPASSYEATYYRCRRNDCEVSCD